MQESGADADPADCTTVQLNINENITAIYPFWQWPFVGEAMKQMHITLQVKGHSANTDGSCVTRCGRIFSN